MREIVGMAATALCSLSLLGSQDVDESNLDLISNACRQTKGFEISDGIETTTLAIVQDTDVQCEDSNPDMIGMVVKDLI